VLADVRITIEDAADCYHEDKALMNCKPENHSCYIQLKMQGWRQVASLGLNESDHLRARKNFLKLINQYPELAQSLRYTVDSVPPVSQLSDKNYRAPWLAR
jgi:hypothetical protein